MLFPRIGLRPTHHVPVVPYQDRNAYHHPAEQPDNQEAVTLEWPARNGIRVVKETGKLYLVVKHTCREIWFYAKEYVGDYYEIAHRIEQDGYVMPTFEENIALLFASCEDYFSRYNVLISDALARYPMLGSTAMLYVEGRGLFIQDHPRIEEGRIIMDLEELENKLKTGEPTVRFSPVLDRTQLDGSAHPANKGMITTWTPFTGKDGAHKLNRIAHKHLETSVHIPLNLGNMKTGDILVPSMRIKRNTVTLYYERSWDTYEKTFQSLSISAHRDALNSRQGLWRPIAYSSFQVLPCLVYARKP